VALAPHPTPNRMQLRVGFVTEGYTATVQGDETEKGVAVRSVSSFDTAPTAGLDYSVTASSPISPTLVDQFGVAVACRISRPDAGGAEEQLEAEQELLRP
jgi:hypothetical protein